VTGTGRAKPSFVPEVVIQKKEITGVPKGTAGEIDTEHLLLYQISALPNSFK
tara:strand:- start:89 stop:244 length:156 start_codon:yes stop_codon:yes gene_type:complete